MNLLVIFLQKETNEFENLIEEQFHIIKNCLPLIKWFQNTFEKIKSDILFRVFQTEICIYNMLKKILQNV
jgi:hypothetical protein